MLFDEAVFVAARRSVYSLAAHDGTAVNWVKEAVGQGETIRQIAIHSKLGSLYVCTDGGKLYALSLDTGDTLWTWERAHAQRGSSTTASWSTERALNVRPVSETDRHAYVSSTDGWVAKLLLPPARDL